MLEFIPYVNSAIAGGAVVGVGFIGWEKWKSLKANNRIRGLAMMEAGAKLYKLTSEPTLDPKEVAAKEAFEAKALEMVKDEVRSL